jgi:hypothetical protein
MNLLLPQMTIKHHNILIGASSSLSQIIQVSRPSILAIKLWAVNEIAPNFPVHQTPNLENFLFNVVSKI